MNTEAVRQCGGPAPGDLALAAGHGIRNTLIAAKQMAGVSMADSNRIPVRLPSAAAFTRGSAGTVRA